jgi:hypothetical protein
MVLEGQIVGPVGQFPLLPYPAGFRRLLMKIMLLAAFSVLALGASAASAQPGSARSSTGPYGEAWAEIHRAKCQNANSRLHRSGRDRPTGHPGAAPPFPSTDGNPGRWFGCRMPIIARRLLAGQAAAFRTRLLHQKNAVGSASRP